MTRVTFKDFLNEEVIPEIRRRLTTKGEEYADSDQFHNFIEGAKRRNISKEDYLLNLVCKHEVSVADLVKSEKFYDYDVANEKIHDILAYYILLLAMFNENKPHSLDEEIPF